MAQFTVRSKKLSLYTPFPTRSSQVVGLMGCSLSPMLVLCGCTWLEMLCRWAVCVPLHFCCVLPSCQLTTAANSLAACVLF